MNNLSRAIADIFAPLTTAQKMRVNLNAEQVFTEPEGHPGRAEVEIERLAGAIEAEIAPLFARHEKRKAKGQDIYERELSAALAGQEDIGATIARAPLRAELADLLAISAAYQDQADQHAGQATRLAMLARQATDQADNLRRMAGL